MNRSAVVIQGEAIKSVISTKVFVSEGINRKPTVAVLVEYFDIKIISDVKKRRYVRARL